MLKDWDDYYIHHFNGYKQKSDVREGCHPLIFRHGAGNRNAVVLVHGLTDSPHFMSDIGEYFCSEMGFDVYVPLLRAHGLKEPEDMKDAAFSEWEKDVKFAIEAAKKSGGKISIGGLSTGGALSVEIALTDRSSIDGGVFLFSAALGLASKVGDLVEILLRTRVVEFLDDLDSTILTNNSPSANPYRYSKMDIGGAKELAKLIGKLDGISNSTSLIQPLFAVHSEADSTADIHDVERLIEKSQIGEMFKIGKNFAVPHASVVLKNPVLSINNSPLEPHNPFFGEMMRSLHTFAIAHNLIKIS
jgi:esterase/lipase